MKDLFLSGRSIGEINLRKCSSSLKVIFLTLALGMFILTFFPVKSFALQAAFSAVPETGYAPLTVSFADQSTPTTYTTY